MVYLDANVFVYAIADDDTVPEAKRARAFLRRIAAKEATACTAAVTWDEVVYVIAKKVDRNAAYHAGRLVLGIGGLRIIPVDQVLARDALRIFSRFGLKPRDSMHAAAALRAGESDVMSDDDSFNRVDGLKRVPI